MRLTVTSALFVACVSTAACSRPKPASAPVMVFAAASTTDVMQQAGDAFERAAGVKVVFSFASSSSLAQQIKAGSPADVFISADEVWMDDLAAADAIRAGSRRDLLANDLVLIAPAAAPKFDVRMTSDFAFAASLPQITRIAVGDPSHVPAGRYARQSLESLGWWSAVEPLLVSAPDVRAALRLVEIGEADAGIVYATDARASAKVIVIARFPGDSHSPIRYPVAQCSDSPDAAGFIDFLTTPEVTGMFERAGFRALSAADGGGG